MRCTSFSEGWSWTLGAICVQRFYDGFSTEESAEAPASTSTGTAERSRLPILTPPFKAFSRFTVFSRELANTDKVSSQSCREI